MPTTEASLADDIAAYLVTGAVATRKGFDIFINRAPDKQNDFFLITDTGGGKPQQEAPIDYPSVQVAYYATASKHGEGWKKIMDAFRLINRKNNIDVGSHDVMYLQALASPQSLGLDPEKNRWLFTFNVGSMVRRAEGS